MDDPAIKDKAIRKKTAMEWQKRPMVKKGNMQAFS